MKPLSRKIGQSPAARIRKVVVGGSLGFLSLCLAAFGQQPPPAPKATVSHAPENEVFREDKSTLVLRVDYEGGSLASAGEGLLSDGPSAADAFSISDQRPRSGRFCLRTKVGNTEDYVSFGALRSETSTAKIAAARYNDGDVFRYRFSFRLDNSWQPGSRDSTEIIWQFKRHSDKPDMFVGIKGRDVVLRCGDSRQDLLFGNAKQGEWMDVCLIVRWSTGENGLVEAFAKRAVEPAFRKTVSFAGSNMRDHKSNSTYLKWGLYRPHTVPSPAQPVRMIYHDDIVIEKAPPTAVR